MFGFDKMRIDGVYNIDVVVGGNDVSIYVYGNPEVVNKSKSFLSQVNLQK